MINRFISYESAVSYILQIPRFCAKNDMSNTKAILKLIGEPKGAHVIHVAGTNGKGSVCAFLESISIAMGKRTGMFTSPHLIDIKERMRIDGQMISEEEFLCYANKVAGVVNQYNETVDVDYHPSFFEYLFFVATYYFNDNDIEEVIYETGLGGRLDATNALEHKDICVITSIGMDHQEYLGDNIADIAAEKAGIISEGVDVVYIRTDPISDEVIESVARQKNARCYPVDKNDSSILHINKKNIDFSYKYGYDSYATFSMNTYAHYQVYNAIVSIKVTQLIYGEDAILQDNIRMAISKMYWPGRLEEVAEDVFVDGCHNVDGVRAFIDSLDDAYQGKRMLLFAAVSDKQVQQMSDMLVRSGCFDDIRTCKIANSRALETNQLSRIIRSSLKEIGKKDIRVVEYGDIDEACYDLIQNKPSDCRVYMCGSLYLVGAVKEYIMMRLS